MLTSPAYRNWRLVAFGMLVKQAALVALVLAGALLDLKLLVVALTLDTAGRLVCLGAPIQSRKTISLSILHQCVAIAFLVAAWGFTENRVFQVMELIVSGIFQGFAAIQFSKFLVQLAQTMNRSDLELRANHLLNRVNSGTAAGSTIVLYLIMTIPLILFLIVVFCWFLGGLMLVAFAYLLPVVLVLLIRVVPMLYNYAVTLNAFRIGAAEMATPQVLTDEPTD